MTEQKKDLREQIACEFCDCPPNLCDRKPELDSDACPQYLVKADSIISLIKADGWVGGVMTEPTTLGEALDRIWKAEHGLDCFGSHMSHGTHFGILFLGLPKETPLSELPKTHSVMGDIDHGTIFARLVLEQEEALRTAIKVHPVIAKRNGLVC